MIAVGNTSYPVLKPGVVVRQAGSELQSEPTGLSSTVETYKGFFNDIVTRAVLTLSDGSGSIGRTYLSPHPDFPSLRAYGVKIKRGAGVVNGTLQIEYRGLDPALSYPPPPIYTVEVTTGNEPLKTHPSWESGLIAGTASNPLNGAQWVSTIIKPDGSEVTDYNPTIVTGASGQGQFYNPSVATFHQWLDNDPVTGKPSIFAGVEDYLVAGIVFKESYTSLNAPSDASSVGSFSDPDGPSPALPNGYAWFYLGETSEDNAGIYRIEGSWKAVPTGPAAKILYKG